MKDFFSRKRTALILYMTVACSLIQSPAAEAGRMTGAGYEFMIYTALTGIVVDLIFTAEFIIKGIKSGDDDVFKVYLIRKGGWIDLVNSIVMLIFVSIPLLVITLYPDSKEGGIYFFLTLYGFSPALRILRILKLSSILGADIQGMASRHTAFIADSSVLILFSVAFVSQIPGYGSSMGIILIYFCAIIMVFFLRIIYRRHFERTVSDIINVIDFGLRRRNYNLQVKLEDKYGGDEIYKLASYYNSVFLPAKMKQILSERSIKK